MSDFMKKNRGNYGQGRKPYINPQFNQPQQFRSQDNKPNGNKKKEHRKETENLNNAVSEALPQIRQMMEIMAQEQSRRADAEERKAEALESIARHVIHAMQNMGLPGTAPAPQEPESAEPAPENAAPQKPRAQKIAPSQPASGKKGKKSALPPRAAKTAQEEMLKTEDMGRRKVLETILNMRQNGATFGQIAKYLDGQNISTFSGKGKWHAQTIHRLFQTEQMLKDSLQDNQ